MSPYYTIPAILYKYLDNSLKLANISVVFEQALALTVTNITNSFSSIFNKRSFTMFTSPIAKRSRAILLALTMTFVANYGISYAARNTVSTDVIELRSGDMTKPSDTPRPRSGDMTKPSDTPRPRSGDMTKPSDTPRP